jgi:hypothetical protein
VISPRVEKHVREMLDYAVHGELQELAPLIQAIGDEAYREAVGMCVYAAAYVAIDVSGRWPADADVREIARVVATDETTYRLDQGEVRDYLSQAALGFQELSEALGSMEAASTLPLLITASLLLRFSPPGRAWFEYLDEIWNAALTAEKLPELTLPAIRIRLRRAETRKTQDATAS